MDHARGELAEPERHPVVRLALALVMILGIVASMVWGSWRVVGGTHDGMSLADRLQVPGTIAGALLVALLVVAGTLLPWHQRRPVREGA